MCDVACATEEGLRNHEERMHPGLCDICHQDLGTGKSLLIHKGSVHKEKTKQNDQPTMNIVDLIRADNRDQVRLVRGMFEVIDDRGEKYTVKIERAVLMSLGATIEEIRELMGSMQSKLDMNMDMMHDFKDDDPEYYRVMVNENIVLTKAVNQLKIVLQDHDQKETKS
jgi:hypothetical protein